MEKIIRNPILRGFHPDPSILRVEEDYYIATSTFQWFPGVQIYHSRDMVHWQFLCRPLDSKRLLDLRGVPDSGGVWAPCLSYDKGMFYLVYSIIWTYKNYYKDVDNYLIKAEDLKGPWSDPVYLNSSGFDPSLFHDLDGRKYLVNQLFNHRDKSNQFLGIVLQEYDEKQKKLIGKPENIFRGSSLGTTEGPHIYRMDGYYYLICAEGGTFYEHAVTVARSRNLRGPYEVDPNNPLLTSYGSPELELQKSGHGSLVQTKSGELYLAHLCARPERNQGRCMLGRETAIQKLEKTEDGWFCLFGGGNTPRTEVPAPDLPVWNPDKKGKRSDFGEGLPEEFQTLREPEEPGWIRFDRAAKSMFLMGRKSLESMHYQSMVARRREDFCFDAETKLIFEPDNFQQMAGMALYYDSMNYIYMNISYDDTYGKMINILECDGGTITRIGDMVPLDISCTVYLRMKIRDAKGMFEWSYDGIEYKMLSGEFDVTHMSDDYYEEHTTGLRFTGTFIALCCQDVSGQKKEAEFLYFDYRGYDTI